jgi:squalene-hopene/tetraprenyl-beta-curcumene cyclase
MVPGTAADWLESVQHEDGGWGERCNTYDDPVFKGQGPSTASQTAWAIMGLCAFDDPYRPSIQRGIEYLIQKQNSDGSWSEHETTGTGFPKVFYLKYDMYRNSWPLLALGTFRKLIEEARAKVNGQINGKEHANGPIEPGVVVDSALADRASTQS